MDVPCPVPYMPLYAPLVDFTCLQRHTYLCLLEEEPNPHIKLVDEQRQIIIDR